MPHFTAPDGASLFYKDEGQGTPVLCLSGLTRTHRDFDYVAPYLSCRLIRMDYRGRGQSDYTGADTYSVQTEAQDALALLDHLGLEQTAILGTSRGGLISMGLAAFAKDRLLGVALNDIGPVIATEGLDVIKAYVGHNPTSKTYEEVARAQATKLAGFFNVPDERWMEESRHHYEETATGLTIRYDPALREAVLRDMGGETPDLWPMFDALDGLPLAIIRGANSDLLSPETFAEMKTRRPDAFTAEVPDRGHVPFLDEPQALSALNQWLDAL